MTHWWKIALRTGASLLRLLLERSSIIDFFLGIMLSYMHLSNVAPALKEARASFRWHSPTNIPLVLGSWQTYISRTYLNPTESSQVIYFVYRDEKIINKYRWKFYFLLPSLLCEKSFSCMFQQWRSRMHGHIQRGQWVQTPPPPLKNHKNKGFLSSTGPDPLKNHKALLSQHSMLGHHRHTSETPMMAHL